MSGPVARRDKAPEVMNKMRTQTAGLRTGNPVLSADTFRDVHATAGGDVMTIGGVVNKTALALAILVLSATYAWNAGATHPGAVGGLTMVGALGAFAVAIATSFRPQWASFTTPLYAVLEGLLLGAVSRTFEARYPGLVAQAVFLTFGTLGALLFLYRTGMIKVTDGFRAGIFAATGGIMLFYLVSFVMSLFGHGIPLLHAATPLGIGFSLVVTGVAALNLVLDFDFIDRGVRSGAPKSMEWYGAFALLVTLVWLYLEMLRLLAKLQDRD
jgi:uncharacterized YccA/Bax inhibitor family protein